jgi:hypothetical protein
VNDTNIEAEAQTVLSRSYLASLPERTARARAALTGGLVYETTKVILPLSVRRSELYQALVGRLLRIMIELVGGVEGVYPAQEMPARELLVRKTVGNVVELSSFVAVGWSPVWLLAGFRPGRGYESVPASTSNGVTGRRRTRGGRGRGDF